MNFSITRFSPLLLMLLAVSAHAGIFDDPQNLKVLPEDIFAQELRSL